jgi:hypothetical protein
MRARRCQQRSIRGETSGRREGRSAGTERQRARLPRSGLVQRQASPAGPHHRITAGRVQAMLGSALPVVLLYVRESQFPN